MDIDKIEVYVNGELVSNDTHQIEVREYICLAGKFNWLFNWIGGGFNDSWGATVEEAIENAEKDMKILRVDRSTIRKATGASSREQTKAGNMLTY